MNLKDLINKYEPFITRSPRVYFSPGRVNLIGEHIDYLGGNVFPVAIDLGTYAFVSSRKDKGFHFFSENFKEAGEIVVDIKDLGYRRDDGWVNYCKGMMQALNIRELKNLKGLNILIRGDLPNGAGLSSSASLEVLTAVVLNEEFGLNIPMIDLVKTARDVENNYIGVNCGIMDQFAVGMGRRDTAMFLNTDTLKFEYVPLRTGEHTLLIANTNKKRTLSDSKYNERREECDRGLAILRSVNKDLDTICDLSPEEYEGLKEELTDPLIRARVEHAVYENMRTRQAVNVLKSGDLISFGRLMNESHDSLRDLFEVSSKELDTLVEAFRRHGALGARMTGAGFGGCVIALVPTSGIDMLIQNVGNVYRQHIGYEADFYPVHTHTGAGISHKLIYQRISDIAAYAIDEELCLREDEDYAINRLLDLFGLTEFEAMEASGVYKQDPSVLLEPLLDHAYDLGRFSPNTVTQRDLFEARIMDVFLPRPSELNDCFYGLFNHNAKSATDYFYNLSQKSNYIKSTRILQNIIWVSETPYGKLDITINLSKPEKDPLDIIASGQKKSSTYPQCLLCKENVGYAGHEGHPGRSNHRIIPVELNGESFYLQYSPYMYYSEHCIVLKNEHVPMKIGPATFGRLFDFVDLFPHYFIGSNADLPIVGGSILSHEHYQGGAHHFPMEAAGVLGEYKIGGLKIKKLHWPLSVLYLESANREELTLAALALLDLWRNYSDESVGIHAYSGKTCHHTITPICRIEDGRYTLYMALRDNRCNDEFPLGIFHPHPEHHHIKKENIGLIEVMGLAILPGRLSKELQMIKDVLLHGGELPGNMKAHSEWTSEMKKTYSGENIDKFLNDAVAAKFMKCLENAGVFKQDEKGQVAFDAFIGRYLETLKGVLR